MKTQDLDLYDIERMLLGLALGTMKAYSDEEDSPFTPSEAKRMLRIAVEHAQERLSLAKERGRSPGCTDLFTGVRIPLSWERSPNGAYELLIWLGTVTHAQIVTATSEKKLSETPFLLDTDVLRDLMRFIVTDPGTSIGKPFPYTKEEMRRAYEEWSRT